MLGWALFLGILKQLVLVVVVTSVTYYYVGQIFITKGIVPYWGRNPHYKGGLLLR